MIRLVGDWILDEICMPRMVVLDGSVSNAMLTIWPELGIQVFPPELYPYFPISEKK